MKCPGPFFSVRPCARSKRCLTNFGTVPSGSLVEKICSPGSKFQDQQQFGLKRPGCFVSRPAHMILGCSVGQVKVCKMQLQLIYEYPIPVSLSGTRPHIATMRWASRPTQWCGLAADKLCLYPSRLVQKKSVSLERPSSQRGGSKIQQSSRQGGGANFSMLFLH